MKPQFVAVSGSLCLVENRHALKVVIKAIVIIIGAVIFVVTVVIAMSDVLVDNSIHEKILPDVRHPRNSNIIIKLIEVLLSCV